MIKQISVIAFVSLLLLTGCGNKNDIKEIRKCYEGYKSSILNQSGNAAVRFIDQNTISHYTTMLDYAKTIKSKELQKLPLIDKIAVLTIRHHATIEDLNAMDGKTLFIWATNKGMLGDENLEKNTLGDVVVEKNKARGGILLDEKNTPASLKFAKEQGWWKIDLTSTFKAAETVMQILRKKTNMDEREFIFYMLEISSGKEVDQNIWYRPLEKPNIPDNN